MSVNTLDLINKSYTDVNLASKPNIYIVILRRGTQEITGNLNMGGRYIKNLRLDQTDFSRSGLDAVNKKYVDDSLNNNLDLKGHCLHGLVHYIHGILNTSGGKRFSLNGCDKIIVPNSSHILTIKVMYFNVKSSYNC